MIAQAVLRLRARTSTRMEIRKPGWIFRELVFAKRCSHLLSPSSSRDSLPDRPKWDERRSGVHSGLSHRLVGIHFQYPHQLDVDCPARLSTICHPLIHSRARPWIDERIYPRDPLSIWLIVSLLLAIFYPAKQVADLAWTLIPLWALTALELARYLDIHADERREAIGAILLTVFLSVFGWLNFTGLVWLSYGMSNFGLRLGLLIGSFILLGISLLLVAFGWSVRVAQVGAVWGLGLVLGTFGLGGTFGSMECAAPRNPNYGGRRIFRSRRNSLNQPWMTFPNGAGGTITQSR